MQNITGELFENEVLEAKITPKDSSTNIDDLGLKYQWIVGNKPIDEAVQGTYTLKAEDVEKKIQIKITSDKYLGEIIPSTERDKSPFNQQDKATKVWVLADYGVFPYKSKLSVKDMNEEENYNLVLAILDDDQKNVMERIKFYDIKVLDRFGNVSQPNGKVTVRLPIPHNFDENDLKALKVTDAQDEVFENEKVVNVDGVNYLEFETNHFSYYALMDEDSNKSREEINKAGDGIKTSDDSENIVILSCLFMMFSGLAVIKGTKNLRKQRTSLKKSFCLSKDTLSRA